MKFAWPNADLSKVIKNFSFKDGKYCIEYFDGTTEEYVCRDKEYEANIKNIMLTQAKIRQEAFKNESLDLKSSIALSIYILSCTGTFISAKLDHDLLANLWTLIAIGSIGQMVYSQYKKREIDKYEMFFDLHKRLDEVNDSEFMKCIEWENIYQKTLDIDTVDNFSYGEIKTLHRKLNEKTRN